MAGPVEQVGVVIACPRCGAEVLQKAMIPLAVTDGVIAYACVPCARKLVVTGTAGEPDAADADDAADAETGAVGGS